MTNKTLDDLIAETDAAFDEYMSEREEKPVEDAMDS